MVVFKPKEGRDVKQILDWTMNNPNFHDKSYYEDEVDFKIPKLSINQKTDLNRHLSNMGLTEVFTDSNPFPTLTQPHDIFIDTIFQEIYFKIDEEGTEAIAATLYCFFFIFNLIC